MIAVETFSVKMSSGSLPENDVDLILHLVQQSKVQGVIDWSRIDDLTVDIEQLKEESFGDFQAIVLREHVLRQVIEQSRQIAEFYTRNGLEPLFKGPWVSKETSKFADPSEAYMERAQAIGLQRLCTASIRLAVFLNQLGQKVQDDL